MSHNIYNDDEEITSSNLCKYLLIIENFENIPDKNCTEIVPCTCITRAIEIATNTKRFCTLFERRGSLGKHWKYLCDISVGVA